MAYTYEELKHKTIAQLREITAGIDHPAVQGFTQLHKEQLLPGLCKALGIDRHVHHHVEGINKSELKKKINELKKERDDALAAHDKQRLKAARRKMHSLKVKIHRATV